MTTYTTLDSDIQEDAFGTHITLTIQVPADYVSDAAHNELVWDEAYAEVDRINAARPTWDELRTKGGMIGRHDSAARTVIVRISGR